MFNKIYNNIPLLLPLITTGLLPLLLSVLAVPDKTGKVIGIEGGSITGTGGTGALLVGVGGGGAVTGGATAGGGTARGGI